MNEFVIDESLSPMEQEEKVIHYISENCKMKDKTLYKFALNNLNNEMFPLFVREGFFSMMLRVKSPVDYLKRALEDSKVWPELVKDFKADGCHGIIISVNRKVFGVKLKTLPNWLTEKDRWDEEQEGDIKWEALVNHVVHHRQDFEGSVVLFKDFGFTGKPTGYVLTYKDALGSCAL